MCNRQFFTETAKRLFLTQSAISHSVHAKCGCQLIRRQGKKVSLTEAGERLLTFARPFLQEMSVVREELSGFEKFGAGQYSIGGEPTSLSFLLPLIKNLK